jgi:hypothetical protein
MIRSKAMNHIWEFIRNNAELIVAIIGIIVGIIGGKCLHTYNKQSNSQNIKNVKKSSISQNITHGLDSPSVIRLTRDTVKEELKLFDFEKAQSLFSKDPHYKIPIMWFGDEEEYGILVAKNQIIDDMTYIVHPKQ